MTSALFSLFCALSNLVAILPAVLFYRKHNLQDSLFCSITGSVSVLYHLNNNTPNFINIFDNDAIRNVDVLISDMLVVNISSYLIFGDSHIYATKRFLMFLSYLPFETYSVSAGNVYRERLMVFSIILFLTTKLHFDGICGQINRYLWSGVVCSLIDILFYRTLAPNSHKYYNVFHGLHHCMAFISIALYIYAVKEISPTTVPNITTESSITRERSSSSLILELDDIESHVAST